MAEAKRAAAGLAGMVAISVMFAAGGVAFAAEEPSLVAPPADETPDVATLIDRAAAALKGGATTTDLLTDPMFMDAHAWPRFRRLISDKATSSRTVLVTPAEPGEPTVVTGSVRRADGRPLAGALVYVYQTSAKGWYSDKAPHISGMEGDTRHARLFGYMLSDAEGKFEFRTVHPTGYPRSDLPAHIHIMVTPAGGSSPGLVSEIRFDDDPRLTDQMKENSRRERYLVCHVTSDPDGTKRVRADFIVP